MTKKLKNRVRVLTVRIITNTDKKDFEIVAKIAEALDLQIGDDEVVESIKPIKEWKGSLARIKEGLL